MEKTKTPQPYPDLELIKRLNRKAIEFKYTSLTFRERIDLFNHSRQRISDLEKWGKANAELAADRGQRLTAISKLVAGSRKARGES